MGRDIRILYVDDDSTSLRIRRNFLEEYDHIDVVTATSMAEGMRRLSDSHVDCVLSDFDMGEQSGLDFLEAVRRQDQDRPFILFSDGRSAEVVTDALSAGATDYVPKSVCSLSYDLLAKRIENVVEPYRVRRGR